MKRSPAVVLTSLVLVAVAPASAGSTATGSPTPPPGWHRSGSAPERPAVAVLRDELGSGETTVAGLLERRAEVLSAPVEEGGMGAIVPRVVAQRLEEETRAAEAEDDGSTTIEIPVASGDLDGVGGEDVVLVSFPAHVQAGPGFLFISYSLSSFQLYARGGEDGRVLWTRELGYDDAFFATDVDGDGTLEVVLAGLDMSYGPVITLDQTVELLDGGTGAARWQKNILGLVEFAYAGAIAGVGGVGTGAIAYVEAGQDLLMSIGEIGGPESDIVLGTLDFESVMGLMTSRFTAETSDGRTGERLAAAEGASVGEVAWGVPAADLSSDGAPDIVFHESGLDGFTLRATTLDGTTHWESPGPRYGVLSATRDLTGDGLADVLVRDLDAFFGSEWTYSVEVFDGSDGTRLWDADTEATPYLFLVGPASGAGTDLGMIGWVPEEAGWVLRHTVLAGGTGEVVWQRDVLESGNNYVLGCTCPSDLDGDGVSEFLFATVDLADPDFATTITAVAGTSGLDLWTHTFGTYRFPLPLGSDANGNGTGDLLIIDEFPPAAVTTLEGSSSTEIWRADAPDGLARLAFGYVAPDALEPAGAEVILGGVLWDIEGQSAWGTVEAYRDSGRFWVS